MQLTKFSTLRRKSSFRKEGHKYAKNVNKTERPFAKAGVFRLP